jgi:protein-L-isoaspartate(D-aspartate) O-methyltransferase
MKKLLLLAFTAVGGEALAEDAQCVPERSAMVETIRAYARSDAGILGPQGISESVLEAMGRTERHRFIPGRSCSVAYRDGPVLIGQGQTISQPFIVALMTHLAAVKFDHTVLEVGTGSGYQAAILARLVRKVCTVEIIPPLAEAAAKLLTGLGHDNVSVKAGDGYHGWPECGPFDAVIVTAALEHVPPPLIEQLKVGGRLVMPVRHSSSPSSKRSHRVRRGCAPLSSCASCPLPGPRIECGQHHLPMRFVACAVRGSLSSANPITPFQVTSVSNRQCRGVVVVWCNEAAALVCSSVWDTVATRPCTRACSH